MNYGGGVRRVTYIITRRCTLKCKLCISKTPYFKNPEDDTYEQAKKYIDNFFSMVNGIEIFSVAGGEPLMVPDIAGVMEYAFSYSDKIKSTLDIVTNATIPFSDDLMKVLAKNKDKARVIISYYGEFLSKKKESIVEQLDKENINYRVQDYAANKNWTYGGWVDFGNDTLKYTNEEELKKHASACIFRQGKYYVINLGELHPCNRQFWRMYNNIIKKDNNFFIDLNADDFDIESAGKKLMMLDSLEILPSCPYCNGCKKDSIRFHPAEQL